jgi:hypothetical protein
MLTLSIRRQSPSALLRSAGKVTCEAKTQTEGAAEKAAGKIQNAVGGAKDAVREPARNNTEPLRRADDARRRGAAEAASIAMRDSTMSIYTHRSPGSPFLISLVLLTGTSLA